MPLERAMNRVVIGGLLLSNVMLVLIMTHSLRVKPSDVQAEVRGAFLELSRRIDSLTESVDRIDSELDNRLQRFDSIECRLDQHEHHANEWIRKAKEANPQLNLPDVQAVSRVLETPPVIMLAPPDDDDIGP